MLELRTSAPRVTGSSLAGGLRLTCRCWDWKADKCLAILYGHSGAVNCLDLHGDQLASGSKDRLVKGGSPLPGCAPPTVSGHFRNLQSWRCTRRFIRTLFGVGVRVFEGQRVRRGRFRLHFLPSLPSPTCLTCV